MSSILRGAAMLCMKSIEMSKEVSEAKLRELSCSASFAHRGGAGYSTSDLNGTGIHANVLGAVPLIRCCLAMRPHFNAQSWSEAVVHGNEEAMIEFEHTQHTDIDIKEIAQSGSHMKAAVELANIGAPAPVLGTTSLLATTHAVPAHSSTRPPSRRLTRRANHAWRATVRQNKKQNHPVFLPMADGEALQCHFGPLGESFTACGRPREQARGESTKYSMVLLAEAGVASMLSKLENLVDEDLHGVHEKGPATEHSHSHGLVHRVEHRVTRHSGRYGGSARV